MRVFERMMREVAGVRDGCEVIGMGVGKEEQEERGSWVEVVDRVIKVALKEVGGGRGGQDEVVWTPPS
jgi:hypothetical protein